MVKMFYEINQHSNVLPILISCNKLNGSIGEKRVNGNMSMNQ